MRTAGIAAAAGIGGACSSSATDTKPEPVGATPSQNAAVSIPFHGAHQNGVVTRGPAAGVVGAFDVIDANKADLEETLRVMSAEIKRLMEGTPVVQKDGGFPVDDSGILGARPEPNELSIIVGVGHSLFDDRFGLADRMPIELQPMPKFTNDFMVTPARSGGDISITVGAASHDAAMYAFRQVMRVTRGKLLLKWMQEGYNTLLSGTGPGRAPVRNLLGFLDGTANPDGGDSELMDDLVWSRAKHGEPEWADGGTYQAIRIIRMQVEFWDRTRLNEQEDIFGRHKESGAPLLQDEETDVPAFADDPNNLNMPEGAHIRRANPRTPETDKDRIVRRGFSYSAGFDENEQLDQGLLFQSFQRSIVRGFIATQRRLDGEVLEEYIRPQGGGIYFVLPGVQDSDSFLGQSLLASGS